MNRSRPIGFGVVGARSFVANAAVLPAIDAAPNARLVATAARSGPVPERWAATSVDSYDAVIEHPDVDVVYLPLPNGLHRAWTERAAAAGKHVLCEKPLAPDAQTARSMADACRAAGVLLAEAWMTPFGARYRHAIELARSGAIGHVDEVDATFTFTIGLDAADNYRWDPAQGGGALLDVGIYCLGPIVELFDVTDVGAAQIAASGSRAASGVDEHVRAELRLDDGSVGRITCSFVADETQRLILSGADGRIVVETEAFTGGVSDTAIVIERGGATQRVTAPSNDAYQAMVEAFADAVTGVAEWPRPVERSIELAQLVERIRQSLPEAPHVPHH